MYVRPAARNTGLGQQLVEAVLDHAGGRVEAIQLSVTTTRDAAYRLYARCGFKSYGVEPKALKIEGRYFDHALMQRDLP